MLGNKLFGSVKDVRLAGAINCNVNTLSTCIKNIYVKCSNQIGQSYLLDLVNCYCRCLQRRHMEEDKQFSRQVSS